MFTSKIPDPEDLPSPGLSTLPVNLHGVLPIVTRRRALLTSVTAAMNFEVAVDL